VEELTETNKTLSEKYEHLHKRFYEFVELMVFTIFTYWVIILGKNNIIEY
jgi:hypothetical protein